jgi:hypothetical protein
VESGGEKISLRGFTQFTRLTGFYFICGNRASRWHHLPSQDLYPGADMPYRALLMFNFLTDADQDSTRARLFFTNTGKTYLGKT